MKPCADITLSPAEVIALDTRTREATMQPSKWINADGQGCDICRTYAHRTGACHMQPSKGKMTPGPWTITERIAEADTNHENDWPGVGISFRQPKASGGDYAHNEAIQVWGEACEANARAIAALPELIQAARDLVETVGYYKETIEAMRRILARIDGERGE